MSTRIGLEYGARVFEWLDGVEDPQELTEVQVRELVSDANTESLDGDSPLTVYNETRIVRVLLPRQYDLTHVWFPNRTNNTNECSVNEMQYSTDTTDGIDGTWQLSGFTPSEDVQVSFLDPEAVALSNVRGVQFRYHTWSNTTMWVQAIGLFGTPSTPDLHLVQTGSLAAVHGADLALSVTAGTQDATTEFRVTNAAASQANGVYLTSSLLDEDLLGSGLVGVAFTDDAGTTWKGRLELGDMAAAAVSGTIGMRVTAFNGEALGVYRPRVVVGCDSWA